jgi:hypothetical protein
MANKKLATRFKVVLNSKSTTLPHGIFEGITIVKKESAASDIIFITVSGNGADLEERVKARTDVFMGCFRESAD